MIVQLPDQDAHLDVVLAEAAIVRKVVIDIIETEKEKGLEKENVTAVKEKENVNGEKEIEQFVKENVNVIGVGKENEKTNHHLVEGNIFNKFSMN